MPVVKVDKKGRIQLPSKVRKSWNLRPKESLLLEVERDVLSVKKMKKRKPETDPLLHDILINPLHSKKKITRTMLRKLKDETWSP